jgi:hypothetical protein
MCFTVTIVTQHLMTVMTRVCAQELKKISNISSHYEQ